MPNTHDGNLCSIVFIIIVTLIGPHNLLSLLAHSLDSSIMYYIWYAECNDSNPWYVLTNPVSTRLTLCFLKCFIGCWCTPTCCAHSTTSTINWFLIATGVYWTYLRPDQTIEYFPNPGEMVKETFCYLGLGGNLSTGLAPVLDIWLWSSKLVGWDCGCIEGGEHSIVFIATMASGNID